MLAQMTRSHLVVAAGHGFCDWQTNMAARQCAAFYLAVTTFMVAQ